MSTIIIFFLLFLLSFIVLPVGPTDFETPKIIFAEAGIIVFCLMQFIKNPPHITFQKPQTIFLAGLLLLTIFDLLFRQSSISFFGNVYRMQGIFLLWLLMLFSLVSQKVDLKKIHWTIFAVILLLQFVLIFFWGQNESQRFIGTFGEPNALSAFALFVWPFSFFAIKTFKKKDIVVMGFALLLVAGIIFLSGSRSAIIGFGLQLIWLLSLKFGKAKGKFMLVCLLIYFASYISPFIFQTKYENRAEIWHAAAYAFMQRPLLGYGFGNTEIALHSSAVQLGLPVGKYYVDSSHNIFLEFAVEGGIVGLVCIGGLLIVTARNFLITQNTRDMVLFLGLITVLSFNPASVVGLLGMWWLIGQGNKTINNKVP